MILQTSRTVEQLSYKQKVLLMVGIFLCIELGIMVSSEFSVALPKIIEDIGGAQFYALVFTVNIAIGAIITPIAGRLSDMYGRRQILIIGILIILISELLTPMLVSNIVHLMIFRGIQGFGGSTVVVVGLIVISDIFDLDNRAKFLGFYGSLNAITAMVAPTVGGMVVEYMSWHWIFYSIIPIGVIGFLLVFKYMPNVPCAANSRFDYLGVFLLSVSILVVVGITTLGGTYISWTSVPMLALFAVLIVGLISFIFSQKKHSNPIMPLHLFKYRVFIVCLFCIFTVTLAATGLVYFMPFFFQNLHGFSPVESGVFLTLRGVSSFIMAAASGFIVVKLKDFRIVAIGSMIIFSVSIFAFTFFTASATATVLTLICLIWGVAAGIYTSIFYTGVQLNLPNKDIATAIGVMQLFLTLSALIATSVLGLFLRYENLSAGFAGLLYSCLGLVLVALLVFMVTLIRRNLKVNDEEVEVVGIVEEVEKVIVH